MIHVSIYNGGCTDNPDICFVFMNPTGRNIASSKEWKGLKSPWIGTKNIWDLFFAVNLLDKEDYDKIKSIKGSEWIEEFASFIKKNEINEFYIMGADAVGCVKSTCFNMTKEGYKVHVLSDCITSYNKKKIGEMLEYYKNKGCIVEELNNIM